MDTRTGELINLTPEEQAEANQRLMAYLNGLTNDYPDYVPVTGDKVKLPPRRLKRLEGR